VLPSFDLTTVRREVGTFAGGLPILLWLFAAVGMLWADVGWHARIDGLGGFHRLLMIPLLLAQFRRSENGDRVVYGFLAAATLLLAASYLYFFFPGLPWPNRAVIGVPVKDDISQSTIFVICAFALIWRLRDRLREQNWLAAVALAGLSALFIGNLIFVAVSRGDIVVAPFLIGLFGWRQFRWKGITIACVVGCILAASAWTGSPYLRDRLMAAIHNVQAYRVTGQENDVGDHIEFLRKSLKFVVEAPFVGHGTGSIADLFRRAAAGETGSAAVATVNPHNQIFAVAIQLGLVGAAVLLAMWFAHYLLFRATGLMAWIGTVVVVENVISSLSSSHLFDFMHGWLYVLGVGVAGGTTLHHALAAPIGRAPHSDTAFGSPSTLPASASRSTVT
jgi:hypothetical protein